MGVKAQIPQWVDQKTDGCWGPKAPGDPEKPRLESLAVLFPAHTTYRILSLEAPGRAKQGPPRAWFSLLGTAVGPSALDPQSWSPLSCLL